MREEKRGGKEGRKAKSCRKCIMKTEIQTEYQSLCHHGMGSSKVEKGCGQDHDPFLLVWVDSNTLKECDWCWLCGVPSPSSALCCVLSSLPDQDGVLGAQINNSSYDNENCSTSSQSCWHMHVSPALWKQREKYQKSKAAFEFNFSLAHQSLFLKETKTSQQNLSNMVVLYSFMKMVYNSWGGCEGLKKRTIYKISYCLV